MHASLSKSHLLIALAWGALLFPPHGPAQENVFEKARITGIVVDTEGNPIADAEVRVIGSKVQPVNTDAHGRFAMKLEDYFVTGNRLVACEKRITTAN